MSETGQVWYLAREGAIVLQGTRSEIAKASRGGFLRGDEACWTEGMSGWESVGDSPRAAWIREASKVHEEMTGTLLQFRAPEGTDELEIPKEPAWAQQQSSKANQPLPDRRRSNRGRRATDRPKRSGGTLVVGLIIGAAIALAGIWIASNVQTSQKAESVSQSPQKPPVDARISDSPTPSPTGPEDAGPVETKGDAAAAAAQPAAPVRQPTPAPDRGTTKLDSKPAQPTPPTPPPPTETTRRIVRPPSDQDVETANEALDRVNNEASPVRSENRKEELKRSLATRQAKFVSCLKAAKIAKPGLRNDVTFVISVSTSGLVTGVYSASGRPGSEYAAACLLGELQALQFPKGEATQVRIKARVP